MGETRRKRAISSFFADFGIVTKPFCNDQRKRTCAGERRTSRAMVVRPGFAELLALGERAIGDDRDLMRIAEGDDITLLAPG